MQLMNHNKSGKPVGRALAAATCALLGVQATDSLAKGQPGEWDVETALLVYSETVDRFQDEEAVISATRNFDSERTLNLKLIADTLTGASPSGATPSELPQTYTSPSGNGSYEVAPGDAPLDDTFKDTRVAVSASWEAPINRDYAYSVGAYGSREYDYTSTAINGSLSRYFDNKNTTLTTGLSLGVDLVDPVGGAPIGLSRMPLNNNKSQADFDQEFAATRESDDTKTVVDALFGVTQVINRQTLMQFTYGVSYSSGYLTDPYKILSVLKYRWRMGKSYLEPHFRYYLQSEADFYKRYLTASEYNSGAPALTDASADYRLGEMTGLTFGAKWGYRFDDDRELALRAEYMIQTNDGDQGFGKLAAQDLYPDTNAMWLQLSYSF
jgi:hypothetical protein